MIKDITILHGMWISGFLFGLALGLYLVDQSFRYLSIFINIISIYMLVISLKSHKYGSENDD